MWLRLVGAALLATVAATFAPATGSAHPHAFIDFTVEVEFDGDGRVVALRQRWLLDSITTAVTVGDVARPVPRARIEAETRRMMGSLAEYGYFTRVAHHDHVVAMRRAEHATGEVRGDAFELGFRLPLATPLALDGKPLTITVFDPTYFIAMVHRDEGRLVRLVGAPSDCRHEIVRPNPSEQLARTAAALDRTQSGGDGLGVHFAERLVVRCGGS